MYLVYSTYKEFGFCTVSQLTAYTTQTEAENFVRSFCEAMVNKHPEWKIIHGTIIGES